MTAVQARQWLKARAAGWGGDDMNLKPGQFR